MMTPRRIFALDGAGALFTAFLLGLVLVRFSAAFGVSERTFHFLAGFAAAICIHSFVVAAAGPSDWVPRLRAVAAINMTYAAVVLIVVAARLGTITLLGIAYFVGEAVVIGGIGAFEWRHATRTAGLTDPGTAPPR